MSAVTPSASLAYAALQSALKAHREDLNSSLQPLGETRALIHYRISGGQIMLDHVTVEGHIVAVCEFALTTQLRWIRAIQQERLA